MQKKSSANIGVKITKDKYTPREMLNLIMSSKSEIEASSERISPALSSQRMETPSTQDKLVNCFSPSIPSLKNQYQKQEV
jgi:hypothetical protein